MLSCSQQLLHRPRRIRLRGLGAGSGRIWGCRRWLRNGLPGRARVRPLFVGTNVISHNFIRSPKIIDFSASALTRLVVRVSKRNSVTEGSYCNICRALQVILVTFLEFCKSEFSLPSFAKAIVLEKSGFVRSPQGKMKNVYST